MLVDVFADVAAEAGSGSLIESEVNPAIDAGVVNVHRNLSEARVVKRDAGH